MPLEQSERANHVAGTMVCRDNSKWSLSIGRFCPDNSKFAADLAACQK